MLPIWACIFLSKEPAGFCSPSQPPHLRGLGGARDGVGSPSAQLCPPLAHTYLLRKEGAGGEGLSLAPAD